MNAEAEATTEEKLEEGKNDEKASHLNDEFAWETLLKQCDARVEAMMEEIDHAPRPQDKLEEILSEESNESEEKAWINDEFAEQLSERPSMTDEEWNAWMLRFGPIWNSTSMRTYRLLWMG